MTMKIPLDINEATIAKHYARAPRTGDPIPDGTIDTLAGSARHAREAAESLKAFYDATLADTSRTGDARLLELRKQALKVAEIQAHRLDAAREQAQADVNALAGSIHEPPAIDATLAAEIRAAGKAMTLEQRREWITNAIKDGDDVTIAALLRAPGYLSGLSAEAQAGFRAVWQQRRYPGEYERLQRLKAASAAQERVARSFLGMVKGMANGTAAQLAEAAENAAAATQAINKHLENAA